jgi:hypothetical protein
MRLYSGNEKCLDLDISDINLHRTNKRVNKPRGGKRQFFFWEAGDYPKSFLAKMN